jgi:hypothetical protein
MPTTTATDIKWFRNKHGQYVAHVWTTIYGERKLVTFKITKGKPSYNGFKGWWADWKVLEFRGDYGSVGFPAQTLASAKNDVVAFVASGYGE